MSMPRVDEDDGEQRRRRKLEEALEVKSLRRIISAYLNYPDAAEEDVKRYERSYKRLPPAHKALLLHYPLKFQRIRRCISTNSIFIFSMLQAFEPPLDMSQDVDICEDGHLENALNDHLFSGERNVSSYQSTSISGSLCFTKSDQACFGEESNAMCKSVKGTVTIEEMKIDGNCDSVTGRHPPGFKHDEQIDACGGNEITNSNGNVSSLSHEWLDPSFQLNVPLVDVDKVRCIVRNLVRDWAAEGQKERDQCYKPILEELDALFCNREKDNPPTCLVPGAGLGRLALEISCLGFICQGNEFSYYMMICSSFILNHSQSTGEWTIYPWVHSNCNSLSDSDQLRPVLIPDIHPARDVLPALCNKSKGLIISGVLYSLDLLGIHPIRNSEHARERLHNPHNLSAGITEGFSMCGGDFVEVYSDPSQVGVWDVVVTCFFIDTAHNIIEYIEIISRILKDGGVWINMGPLLYHFADMYGQEDEMSIELSLEDVKRIALHHGFHFEKEKTIETTYTTNPRSMMQNRYYAAFWTMRKKTITKEQHTP